MTERRDSPVVPADARPIGRDDLHRRVAADDGDEFFVQLDRLWEAVSANLERNKLVLARIEELRQRRYAGQSMTTIVEQVARPLTLDLLRENLQAIQDCGAGLRRIQVRALAAEGLSHADIARLLGVSRQRISAILTNRE